MVEDKKSEQHELPDELEEFKSAGRSVERTKDKLNLKIPFWGKLLAIAILVFLSSIGYLRTLSHENKENGEDIQEMSSSDVPPAEKRKKVPDITLFSKNGAPVKLDQYKGKVVLLSFWASWCTPCLVELPTFIDLHEKLAKKGLVILPLNVDEPDVAKEFVPSFWNTKKFPFENFYDHDNKASTEFKIDGLPSNFVLDKTGKLVATGFGANDWASDASVQFIEQLLSE